MLGRHAVAGGSKQIAGHDHHAVAVFHGLVDGVNAVLIGVAHGLVVAALQAGVAAELGHAFVGVLVEGVVVDVAHVGHEGNLLGPVDVGRGVVVVVGSGCRIGSGIGVGIVG